MENYLFICDVKKGLIYIGSLKGRDQVKKLIEDDTYAVNIDRVCIWFLIDHLRTNVLHRSTECCPFVGIGLVVMPRPSEVANFDVIVLVEQYILKLKIPMHDMPLLHEGDGIDELLEDGGYLFIGKMFFVFVDYIRKMFTLVT